MSPAPSSEDIARRAYEIYRARGGDDGRDMDDWLQAERELLNERKKRVMGET
jgi:outer membrane protein TolC